MDPNVFQFIGTMVEQATSVFITPAATELMSQVKGLAVICVALYITLTGYAIVTGAIQAPFWTFMKQCMKIVFIAFFAFTVQGYSDMVMGALNGLETGLTTAMGHSGGTPANIYQTIDQSMGRGFDIVAKCFEKAHQAGWNFGSVLSWSFAGIIVALGTVLITVLGGAVVIVAKFSLAIVFALGPLFIFCLMFPATAKFFDSWLSQALNYIITIVLMAIIMTFVTSGYDSFISTADFNGTPGGQSPMFASLQIGALTGVFVWIILQANGMASGLVGGVSMAAMGIRHLATPITGGLSMAKGAGRLINPTYTKRDMASGMMTSNTRAGHMAAGNTMWNPAYRQHVFSNAGKNWGRAKGGSVNQQT